MEPLNKSSLRGYRIGVWAETRSDWELAGANILSMIGAPRDHEQFVVWWEKEVQRSEEDGLTLVVHIRKKLNSTRYDWLKQIEEEEFEGDGEKKQRVRFTTSKSIRKAMKTNCLLCDTWGDSVEKE